MPAYCRKHDVFLPELHGFLSKPVTGRSLSVPTPVPRDTSCGVRHWTTLRGSQARPGTCFRGCTIASRATSGNQNPTSNLTFRRRRAAAIGPEMAGQPTADGPCDRAEKPLSQIRFYRLNRNATARPDTIAPKFDRSIDRTAAHAPNNCGEFQSKNAVTVSCPWQEFIRHPHRHRPTVSSCRRRPQVSSRIDPSRNEHRYPTQLDTVWLSRCC